MSKTLINQNVHALNCLRCNTVVLNVLSDSSKGISFYECPSCLRNYAQKKAGSLTYRWGHPLSLALYFVLFELEPLRRVQQVAGQLIQGKTRVEIDAMVHEIKLELAHPTQQVREILDNTATEKACRAFLAELVCQLTATKFE